MWLFWDNLVKLRKAGLHMGKNLFSEVLDKTCKISEFIFKNNYKSESEEGKHLILGQVILPLCAILQNTPK